MKSRGQTPGLWSMLRVKICNSNRAAVCTRHTTAQTHQADLYAVALISIGRFDPLYGFMQNRRKLCARPDLFYWKQARIIISAYASHIIGVNPFQTGMHAPVCANSSLTSATLWPWTERRATQIVARRKIAHDDKRRRIMKTNVRQNG